MTVSPARRAAFDILYKIDTKDAYVDDLLASNRFEKLSREDHALMHELTMGVLRRQIYLDYLIEHYSHRKISKLDIEVAIALRLGLYQLRYLSRIPHHAAINESVNIVKEHSKRSAAPMVNAVLRAAQRDVENDPSDLSESLAPPSLKLSIQTSHPEWLIRRWITRFGEDETRELAEANNKLPNIAFRFIGRYTTSNESKAREWFDKHDVITTKSKLTPGAEIITNGRLSPESEPVKKGWIYQQDEASQLTAHMTASIRDIPQNILDLCSAPGSKTTLLSSLLHSTSKVFSSDIHLHRLRAMKSLCSQMGIMNINFIQLDGAQELPFISPPQFNSVLVDAPCTGLGTLQRHPDIKLRAKEEKIFQLAKIQKRLIENASEHVLTGGLLTYSVCSTEPEEGEEVIAWFREHHPEYRDVTRERLIELNIEPDELLTSSHGARTWPHKHGCEGFFICVLWKRNI